MPILIDTSVAILMRDTDSFAGFLRDLDPPAYLSAISRIELENGVYRFPEHREIRRASLDFILQHVPTLEFGEPEIAAYRGIVTALGYNRRKTLDRMIAATALAHGLALVTANGRDFTGVPGLDVKVWLAP